MKKGKKRGKQNRKQPKKRRPVLNPETEVRHGPVSWSDIRERFDPEYLELRRLEL